MMRRTQSLFVVILSLLVGMALATQAFAAGGQVIVENDPNAGTVKFFGGWTTIYYDAGTCAVKCRFNQTLTAGAYAKLDQVPLPYLTGVFTQLADGSAGSYMICFETRLIGQPAVYQYSAGLWTLGFNSQVQL